MLADLQAIAQLGRNERLRFDQISDAVRRYKVGVTEDPRQNIDRTKIRNAHGVIQTRVKGQHHAIEHLLDLIKRAIVGVGRSKQSGRPRGVAFLAGPTGVRKTELAKTITSLLFGDESAYNFQPQCLRSGLHRIRLRAYENARGGRARQSCNGRHLQVLLLKLTSKPAMELLPTLPATD